MESAVHIDYFSSANRKIRTPEPIVIIPAAKRTIYRPKNYRKVFAGKMQEFCGAARDWIKSNPVLSCNDDRKTQFDLFVMILATYNCFQIPLEVAFDPDTFQMKSLKTLSVIIDLVFLLDMLVAFRTTYIDTRSGIEITDTKEIRINYLKGQFTIDFLATMPFDSVAELILGEAGIFKLLGALKLVRILRLARIMTYLRIREETKALLNLFKLLFYLIIYVHCFGCVWWMLVASADPDNMMWVPLYLYGARDDWKLVYT